MYGISHPHKFEGTFPQNGLLYDCAYHTNPFPPALDARAADGDDEEDEDNDE